MVATLKTSNLFQTIEAKQQSFHLLAKQVAEIRLSHDAHKVLLRQHRRGLIVKQ